MSGQNILPGEGCMTQRKDYIYCIISVITGIIIFAVFGINKRVTFCDEIYTYMITNSPNGAYSFADAQWYTRDEVKDVLAHTANDSVWQMIWNVKGDPHPPLYYGFIYIASVISGGSLSVWVALSVNAVMYIASIILFWLTVYELFKKPVTAMAATMVYSLNAGIIGDAMLLRMYMQFTFFVIAFAYFTLRLYRNKDALRYYIILGIITACGFLTQYYFCFIAIIFFAVWCIYNLVKKKYSRIVKYLASMIGAVAVDTIIWRYWISTMLNNTNSDIIKENALNFSNIFVSLYKGIMTVQLVIFQKWYAAGMVFTVIVVLAALLSKRAAERCPGIRLYVGTLALGVYLYAAIVYYLTPSYLMSGRYFYAAAALELLLIAVCVCALVQTYMSEYKAGKIGMAVLGAGFMALDILIFVFGYGIDYYPDADEYDSQKKVLEQYADIPWILCGDENWQMSANYYDYTIPNIIMRITDNSECRKDEVLENAERFLVIAPTDENDWGVDTALYYYIGCTGRFVGGSEVLMKRNGLTYYIAYAEK